MNVALYGEPARWAMTERGRTSLRRDAGHIAIGPSAMVWDGKTLTISINEVTAPWPSRLRGTVTVTPRALNPTAFTLDAAGRHRWQPIAPLSDVVIAMDQPALSWHGTGYFDTNNGDEPLEDAFRSWTWSRFDLEDRARIAYDVVEKDGRANSLSLRIKDGLVEDAAPLTLTSMARGWWGVERVFPSDPGTTPRLVKPLEDAPFYTRSALRATIDGLEVAGMNEGLSLARLTAPWVRMLLPFRMPRRTAAASNGGMR